MVLLANSKAIEMSLFLATRTSGLIIMVVGQPAWTCASAIKYGGLPTSIDST